MAMLVVLGVLALGLVVERGLLTEVRWELQARQSIERKRQGL